MHCCNLCSILLTPLRLPLPLSLPLSLSFALPPPLLNSIAPFLSKQQFHLFSCRLRVSALLFLRSTQYKFSPAFAAAASAAAVAHATPGKCNANMQKKKLSTAQSNNNSNNLPQPTNQQNELGSLANSLAAQGEQTGALSLSLCFGLAINVRRATATTTTDDNNSEQRATSSLSTARHVLRRVC